MSRASRNHTILDQRAVRRTALAQIETLTRERCYDLLAVIDQLQLGVIGAGIGALQREVLNAFQRGEINARDIERAWQGDRRAQ